MDHTEKHCSSDHMTRSMESSLRCRSLTCLHVIVSQAISDLPEALVLSDAASLVSPELQFPPGSHLHVRLHGGCGCRAASSKCIRDLVLPFIVALMVATSWHPRPTSNRCFFLLGGVTMSCVLPFYRDTGMPSLYVCSLLKPPRYLQRATYPGFWPWS